MGKQLGDFGQFWGMVWEQEVEKIVMVTNLVEGEKAKCEQYWPDHYQSKLYGDIEVVCKVDKLYADFIWRQFKLSKNSEERSLHHLQFTSWPAKDVPDNETSLIDLRQRVNALPNTFDGPTFQVSVGAVVAVNPILMPRWILEYELRFKMCAHIDGNYCIECKTGFYDNECGSSCAPNCGECHRRD
ncbi:PTPRC-like protein, partial [Mya arenaria]